MFRALFLLILLALAALCLAPVRRWLARQWRRPNAAEIKRNLALALGLYFLLSVVLTVRDCSQTG